MFAVLESAKRGDASAIDSLVSMAQDAAVSAARYHTSRFVEQEDAVQDTLLSVFKSYTQCSAESKEQFAAWVRAVLKSKLINAARDAKALKRGGGKVACWVEGNINPVHNASGPHDIVVARETLAQINDAAKAINGRAAKIVEMKGLGYPEKLIASEIGTTRFAVSGVIKRLRANMVD